MTAYKIMRLRDATEDDVIDAIEGNDVEHALDGVAPDVLLEFFCRMLIEIADEV